MKTTQRTNFRVQIEPDEPLIYASPNMPREERAQKLERSWQRDCESIAEQIRRHVDGLPGGRDKGVSVVCDTISVCGFCGSDWTEDDANYNGGCCDADEATHNEAAA